MENNQDEGKPAYFDYFSQIEETFIRLHGKNLLLSANDWALIERWQGLGIPAALICQTLEKCFAAKRDGRPIRSLKYCQSRIEEDFRRSQK